MLIVFTVKDVTQLFSGSEGRQLLDDLVTRRVVEREYLLSGNWGPIEKSRYNLGTVSPILESTAKVWKYIKERAVQPAEGQKDIISTFFNARLDRRRVCFFSPWGPRYKKSDPYIKESDLEIKTLEEIGSFFEEVKRCGFSVDFVVMPADFYGTNINNLSPPFVREYFNSLKVIATSQLKDVCNLTVKPWSRFKAERAAQYDDLRRKVEMDSSAFFSDRQFEEALKTARVFNSQNAYGSAWNYCVERVIEAILVEEAYKPIKLSLVRKEKDELDGSLKRIYVLQKKAPWLEGD